MLEARTIAELRTILGEWRRASQRIGLVPTMGNLHQGHLNLVRRALREADRVVVSVFVNPTQFAPGEDYQDYPRTFEQDWEQLEALGVDMVFAPSVGEMYPDGTKHATCIDVGDLGEILCGDSRPGHFKGMASVVNMLLNLTHPDVAVFGQKDYQQLVVIRRMVCDLHIPVAILGEPTARESSGLALSSRNRYLSENERRRAPALYHALQKASAALSAGERDFRKLEAKGCAELEEAGLQPEYFTVREAGDLAAPDPESGEFVVMAAARLGHARLIDNIVVRS